MHRRRFIASLSTTIALPRVAPAQQKAVPVVGYLHYASPGPTAPNVAAFRQGLSETGYVEGQNVAIEYRWAEGGYDRLPARGRRSPCTRRLSRTHMAIVR